MIESEAPKDWRGTVIHIGDTVIYGAPVGRSIAMVEARVDGFTDSGRVWLQVLHRAYGGWGNSTPRVHVGADRLTIIKELPPTDLPLESDKHAESRNRSLAYHRQRLTELESGEVPARREWQPAWNEEKDRPELIKYHRSQITKLEKLNGASAK